MNALEVLADLRRRAINVTRVCANSSQVRPGDVFIALPGARVDGRDFIADAMVRGAAAIVAEAAGLRHLPAEDLALEGVRPPIYLVTGLAAQCGELASAAYGMPSAGMWLAAVTGTNGKTSISQWIAQALGALATPCGVIGTLGSGLPGEMVAGLNTTPDALSLQSTLAEFKQRGISCCALEASSIGLEQGRMNAMHIDVAVLSNLTRDHLDHHGTMADYAAAKQRLFDWPGLAAAVINADDAFGRSVLRGLPHGVRPLAYALDAGALPGGVDALVPDALSFSGAGIEFNLRGVPFVVPVVGRFNASNVLAVIGTLLVKGLELHQIASALSKLLPPPGRMQTLGGIDEPLVVVDYAHTPDALEQVLGTLRSSAAARGGRLVCVFGCGGDRDPGKRPLMARIAQKCADVVWVTSDNPRGESPQKILDEVVIGLTSSAAVHGCLDRAQAIEDALRQADDADVVLLAGKGHEQYQEIAGVRHPFSDLDQARSALAGRRPGLRDTCVAPGAGTRLCKAESGQDATVRSADDSDFDEGLGACKAESGLRADRAEGVSKC